MTKEPTRPRVRFCWECGRKLWGNHHDLLVLDGHERTLHRACAKRIIKERWAKGRGGVVAVIKSLSVVLLFVVVAAVSDAPAHEEPVTMPGILHDLQVVAGIREGRPEGWIEDIVVERAAPRDPQWQSIAVIPEGQRWKIVRIAADYEIGSLLIRLNGNPTPLHDISVTAYPRPFVHWMEAGSSWMWQIASGPLSVWVTVYIEVYAVE